MRKVLITLAVCGSLGLSACFFLGFKQLMLPGYERGLAGSPANFDKLQAAAAAQGWTFKRKQGLSDYDLVVFPEPGKALIFQANAETNIIAYNCKGLSKNECKAACNKVLSRAFNVVLSRR